MVTKATEADRALLLDYCGKEPHANMFIIADIQNFGFDSDFQEVWKQQDENGRLCGIILRYNFNYLYYTQTPLESSKEAARFLNGQKPSVFSAKPEIIDALAPEFGAGYSRKDMDFLVLPNADTLVPAPDGVQKAVAADAEEIAGQYAKIEEFAGLYNAGNAGQLAETIRTRIESGEGEHYYLRIGGEIAVHANSTAETEKSGIIGGVFTLPNHRRQGLAAGVVSALCRSMLARGVTPCLFFSNPDAGKMYYSLGFVKHGKWTTLEPITEE